jgi:hypothetical protein
LPPLCGRFVSKQIFFGFGNKTLYYQRQIFPLGIGQKLFNIYIPPPFINAHDVQAVSIIRFKPCLFLLFTLGEAVAPIAHRLSEAQISAIAAYLAVLE